MIVAVHQPQYLPWAGYFDKMDRADRFVLLDTVQFKKGEWQNRNRFKTDRGPAWVTVPVRHRFGQLIREVEVNPQEPNWPRKHTQALRTWYGGTPYVDPVAGCLAAVWERAWTHLAELNRATIEALRELLGIDTPLILASDLAPAPEQPDERLIAICSELGADTYLAGAGGPAYMDLEVWRGSGIDVIVHDFTHPVYDQPFGDFLPAMSAVDLLCNCGPDSLGVLRSANSR